MLNYVKISVMLKKDQCFIFTMKESKYEHKADKQCHKLMSIKTDKQYQN